MRPSALWTFALKQDDPGEDCILHLFGERIELASKASQNATTHAIIEYRLVSI
jgi:hypothetical protein